MPTTRPDEYEPEPLDPADVQDIVDDGEDDHPRHYADEQPYDVYDDFYGND